MTRHLPRRYQLIRQTATEPDQELGILVNVVEFPDGACIGRATSSPPSTIAWESLDAVKSYCEDISATIERID